MYARFEDPFGTDGGMWTTPEYIIEAPHVANTVLDMFLPEELEYAPRGKIHHESVAIGRRRLYDAEVSGGRMKRWVPEDMW